MFRGLLIPPRALDRASVLCTAAIVASIKCSLGFELTVYSFRVGLLARTYDELEQRHRGNVLHHHIIAWTGLER